MQQYSWIAPLVADNKNARIRVVAYDAACNPSRDDGDANFALWNPGGVFPHVAETPIYMVGGGFRSVIHLCSASSTPVTVEIGVRNRYGTGLAGLPTRFTLTGTPRAIDVSTYLTQGTPSAPGDTNINMGSIRMRHNGTDERDVRAVLAVDQDGDDESFIAPFVYAASAQSAASAMQCAPMYYLDDDTSTRLALQNVTNSPVPVDLTLHYGTGAASTPNGNYHFPHLTLAPQQTIITDLTSTADELEGTHWGSIQLNAPPQTVVAHTVMVSHENRYAFTSSFVDPAMSAGTTKVASTLKLDYATGMKSCVMVCNTSSTETRSVTATFQTDNGVLLPSRQLSLAPGKQSMIELDSQQLLSPGSKTMANVRLSYAGDASDIIAGAVSMSAPNSCAIPAQFVEPKAGDGRRLVAPFFRFDERTTGILQISNLGAVDIKAGAMMEFADTTLPELNTDLVTVPAGGTVTLDLRDYFSRVDDSVAARGCLEVLHNGAPGTVTGSFTAIGLHNHISLHVPLDGGPSFAGNDMELFPNNQELQPGESMEMEAMTGGALSSPSWSASSTVGNPGSISGVPSSAPTVYKASYTSPTDPTTVAVKVRADASSSGGPTKEGTIILSAIKIKTFTTTLGSRMVPEGNTSFTINGGSDFPDAPLTAKFKQGDGASTAEVPVTRDPGNAKVLTGVAPPNSAFIGDCNVFVLQGGKKISKDKSGAAYYAFNPPSAITGVSPDGYDRLGGILTITGSGFRTFLQVRPLVRINSGPDFEIDRVEETRIVGVVGKADSSIKSCRIVGHQPCKKISVTNPGGRSEDELTSGSLYNLKAGPAAVPQSRFPDNGFSIGGTVITIRGENLDFVDNVTVGGTDAPIITRTRNTLVVVTLPHSSSQAGSTPIVVFHIDDFPEGGSTVPGGGFRYDVTPPTELTGLNLGIFIVGPGEGIFLAAGPTVTPELNCVSELDVSLTDIPSPVDSQFGVQAARVRGSLTCTGCACPIHDLNCDRTGNITFTLQNTAAPTSNLARRRVVREVTAKYSGSGTCTRSF